VAANTTSAARELFDMASMKGIEASIHQALPPAAVSAA